jgi:cell division protein ZapA (FtsZ GTPase activity inhibitor)
MGDTTIVIPAGGDPDHVEEQIEETGELAEEVHELAQTVQLGTERQTEIIAKVNACHEKLELLSQSNQAENPVQSRILQELSEIRTELGNLKNTISDLNQSNLKPSELTAVAVTTPPAPPESAPNPDVSMVEPERDAKPATAPRRRARPI